MRRRISGGVFRGKWGAIFRGWITRKRRELVYIDRG
jgi:hypothetical protein